MTSTINVIGGNTDSSASEISLEKGGLEIVERLTPEWLQLCDEAQDGQPFTRPEWVSAYVRAFAPDDKLVVIAARSKGRLTAVLPLLEQRTLLCGLPATRWSGLANLHSCRLDLLRAAGPRGEAAVAAIWAALKDARGWDFLELSYVPENSSFARMVALAQADGYPAGTRPSWQTPYLSTEGWDGTREFWIKRTGQNFRHTIRRISRKLDDKQPMRLIRVDTADAASLQRFYDVEASGWKGGEGTAVQSQSQTRRFYDEIARAAARYGYFSLYFLEINGELVAAHYGLRYRGRYLVPKCAYDERFSKLAPGHLIVNEILRDSAENGLREFDFLGPAMEWKEKWVPQFRAHSAVFIFRKGLYGSLLHRARFKLQPMAGAAWRRIRGVRR
jgi:CelD/BcsL family acetyltransferase involved in cellulose biosynthesis